MSERLVHGHKERAQQNRGLFLWVQKMLSLCSKAKLWISSVVAVSLYQILLTASWEMWGFLGETAGREEENHTWMQYVPTTYKDRCMEKTSFLLCQGFTLNGSSSFAPGTHCEAEQTALQGHSIGIRDPALNGKYLFASKTSVPTQCNVFCPLYIRTHCTVVWSGVEKPK